MIEEEKAKHPPGTRLMPEEERLETLKDLKESRKEINTALEKMPVMSRTIAGERQRRELEEKLVRVERAIETFEKKTVYVAFWYPQKLILYKKPLENQNKHSQSKQNA